MQLKDFKKEDPEKYKQIIEASKLCGANVDDESEISRFVSDFKKLNIMGFYDFTIFAR